MSNFEVIGRPAKNEEIEIRSRAIGFTMSSDLYVGTLLQTLVASKPGSHFLELGTGTGLSLSWMVDGMDAESTLISVDNDPGPVEIAKDYFGDDARVQLVCGDASQWMAHYNGPRFDLVFADAWPGKYSELDEILDLIEPGGFYVVDDLLPQPNWPEGHSENVKRLVAYLEDRKDFVIAKLNWSTGLIIAVKR